MGSCYGDKQTITICDIKKSCDKVCNNSIIVNYMLNLFYFYFFFV